MPVRTASKGNPILLPPELKEDEREQSLAVRTAACLAAEQSADVVRVECRGRGVQQYVLEEFQPGPRLQPTTERDVESLLALAVERRRENAVTEAFQQDLARPIRGLQRRRDLAEGEFDQAIVEHRRPHLEG